MTAFMTALIAILGAVAGVYIAYYRLNRTMTQEVIDVL